MRSEPYLIYNKSTINTFFSFISASVSNQNTWKSLIVHINVDYCSLKECWAIVVIKLTLEPIDFRHVALKTAMEMAISYMLHSQLYVYQKLDSP